ncbi:MAG: thiamine diphosphokinase [Spirochaetes bacterium]|nr:MAG: thiamine diphosphokinase [Spirochaetota bacterium]
MTRGILLIGGLGPDSDKLKKLIDTDNLICAADSGLDLALSAGILPDRIVGDMDSLSDKSLLNNFPADTVEIYPEDKDETDTELGLFWLRKHGCGDIFIIGGGEGRLDHTLALKALFAGDNPPAAWFTAREKIWSLEGCNSVSGLRGSTISFVTAGGGPWEVSSRGLQWELDKVEWSVDTISLSNRLKSSIAEITVHRGRLLVIQPF